MNSQDPAETANPSSLGFYLFVGSVTVVLTVETIVWFVSRWGIQRYIRTIQQQLVETANSSGQLTLGPDALADLNQLGSRFILLLVMAVLTLTLTIYLTILRWWVFSPIDRIVKKNETSDTGRPEPIAEENIPTNEIGQLMRSRNEMLSALDEIFSEEAIETLVQAVDAKDPYTRGHSRRVGAFARSIGWKLSLSEDRVDKLEYAGTLHDLGKIGIDDAILTKPDSLTDEEFEIIKTHPEKGIEILQVQQFDEEILQGINYHHEHYDGSGYPEGLEGKEIPLFGRILAVADAVDAMLSDRAYRDALDREIVFSELEDNQKSQFDPKPAEAALSLLKEADPEKIPKHYIKKMDGT